MSKSILLADDSVTIQKVVELTFLDEDFHVSAVSNGAEAIARLGETTPDIVIADVHMPGADGYEVCRRSKELHPSVPVLLLAGTFEAFDADEATRCGADGYLKKPFDSQELLRRVRELSSGTSVARPQPISEPLAEPAESDQEWEPIADEAVATAPSESGGIGFELAAAAPVEAVAAQEPFATTTFHTPAPQPLPVVPAPEPAVESAAPAGNGALSDADVDRIARRVLELAGERVLRDVAWEVVPDLAEVILRARIRELEASVE